MWYFGSLVSGRSIFELQFGAGDTFPFRGKVISFTSCGQSRKTIKNLLASSLRFSAREFSLSTIRVELSFPLWILPGQEWAFTGLPNAYVLKRGQFKVVW